MENDSIDHRLNEQYQAIATQEQPLEKPQLDNDAYLGKGKKSIETLGISLEKYLTAVSIL